MISKEMILSRSDSTDYIDFHIHIDGYDANDINNKILYIANSVDRESYNRSLAIAAERNNVIAIFGIHPEKSSTESISESFLDKIYSRSILIGEIGLDFHWIEDMSTYSPQREIFRTQLELSSKYKCIPSIHTKGAEREVLQDLKRYAIDKSVIHWYSGPEELISQYIDQGCYFTIGPDIFTDSEVYKHIPLSRMFAETDNPTGMPWILGEEDSADDIIAVYGEIARKLQISEETLIAQFKENLKELLKRDG